LEIYRITKGFPKEERYGLTSQIRKAAVSVHGNIAEGYGRKTTPEYTLSACDAQAGRFLYIAYGSNCELETQILLSGDLGYIETGKLEMLQEGMGPVCRAGTGREVERMLKALIKSLERKRLTPFESSNPPACACPHADRLHQLIGRRTIKDIVKESDKDNAVQINF